MKTTMYTRDILLIMVSGFFYLCCNQTVEPIVAGYAESIGASGVWMGIVSALITGTAVVCRPITGNLSDRVQKSRLVLVGSLMMLTACLGYAFVPSIWVLAVMRCLHGAGYACCSIGLSTWLTMLLPPEKLGSGVGLYGTVNALAMAVGPAIGIRSKGLLGYRGSFLISGACALITIVLTRMIGNHGTPVNPDAKKRSAAPQLVYPRVLPIAIAVGLIAIPYTANKSFLVSYAEGTGLNIQPDLFFTLYAIILIFLRLSLRKLYDKLTFSTFLLLCSFSMVASLLSLYFMQGHFLMFIAAIFMAGSYGIMYSVAQSATASAAPPEQRGIAMGTYYLGLDFGSAVGPIVGGYLYGNVDLHLFYPLLGVAALLCIGMYFVCRKIYGQPAPAN